jgi:leucyl-tRNA synthetase
MAYDFRSIEKKWQTYWKENRTFAADKLSDKPKYYVLDMFPYPSGAGLHVGHPLGYIATDVVSRYKRLKGYNVLHPMGFDSFGLPGEQYAIQTGIHPAKTTETNCVRYREQMELMGLDYDPDAWLRTSDPAYYKWTQWIFLRLFEHWYDQAAEKARPITELVAAFEQNGNQQVQAATDQKAKFTAEEWKSMSPAEQNDVLMNYRLAYNSWATVNWCPALGTVLANDEVKEGRSERGNYPVERKKMRQWMLRITAYADRLLYDLDLLDWSDAMKAMQANWIGRSEGANITYEVAGFPEEKIEVFTTRPDTLFGNTFMVLAPEHPLVEKITTEGQQAEVEKYVAWAKNRTERERMADTRKTGAFTGGYAIHPLSGDRLPVWISDYVVITYGTGAIMAVPAHDQRDWDFAKKFGLKIVEVIEGGNIEEGAFDSKDAPMINSDFIDGLPARDAITAITQKLEEMGVGKGEITYKMRDAIWSRQRYWGEPTPVLYKEGVARAVADEELPLTLPHLDTYKPSESGEPPLARAGDAWRYLPDGSERDLNTMPGAAGSSWYFFRYFDAHNDEQFADPERIKYWMPVDLYVGGTEHAVGHLLYARLWTKFLYDLGYCPVKEPFQKLVNQGMIQGVSEKVYMSTRPSNVVYGQLEDGSWREHKATSKPRTVFVSKELVKSYPDFQAAEGELERIRPAEVHIFIDYIKDYGLTSPSYLDGESIRQIVEWRPEYAEAIFVAAGGYYQNGVFHPFDNGKGQEIFTKTEVEKMSKSKFNVVNPDSVVGEYGTDTFRLFEMFLGPLEMSKPWDTQSITGVYKFLNKAWSLFFDDDNNWVVTDEAPTDEDLKELHKALKQAEESIERLAFNTAVPAFMVLANYLNKANCRKRAILEPFLIMLSPFAPHFCEELWQRLGHEESISQASFPQWEEKYLVEDSIEYPVQVNGRMRAKITVAADAGKEEVEKIVLADERVQKYLDGKPPRKVIVVPGRIVNVVV